jgi:hypothetical protein
MRRQRRGGGRERRKLAVLDLRECLGNYEQLGQGLERCIVILASS